MRLLNSTLRWYRDRLIALSACALVALSVAFGFLPRLAVAATPPPVATTLPGCTDPSQTPENNFWLNSFVGPSVGPGDLVGGWYADENPINTGAYPLVFTLTGPAGLTENITPSFDVHDFRSTVDPDLGTPNDYETVPGDNDDNECALQINITGHIPTLHNGSPLPPGDYTVTLGVHDSDQTHGTPGQDLGSHTWMFRILGNPGISTEQSAGGAIGTVIHDTANVTGGHSPTGNVTFNLYAPGDTGCLSTVVFTDTQNLGVVSGNYTTAAVGTYHWKATYNGDPNNLTATSACDAEPVTTIKAQPSIGTTPSAGTVGTVINDTATVSGGYSPTGDVTFNLYAPDDTTCVSAIQTFANVTLSGLTATSGNYTTAAVVGTYRWTATYNGNANNLTATSGCQDEQVTTTAVPPGAGTLGTPPGAGTLGTQQGAGTLGTQQGAGTLGASVTLPRAGAGPQHPVGSAAGGGGPSGAVGIMSILLLALVVSVLFVLRRRHGAEMGQPGA